MQKDLTQGSIKKHYFNYLKAAFGSAMISCIYGLVDAAVVGQYQGPPGAAALSIVMPIWNILYSLGLLVGIGGSVNYSFYRAQGKKDKANAYFTLSLCLMGIIAAVCWVGMTVFDEELLRLFGADDSLLPLAMTYLGPVKYVIPAFPFTQFLAAFLRNDNAPMLATAATLLGGVFNIFGDVYFVFGLDLGMRGAGLATAAGAVLSVAVMLTHFLTRKKTLRFESVFGCFRKVRYVLANGFSAFVSDISMGIVAMFFNRQIMKYFGADALAVFGVIVQITAVVQCTTYGIGQAVQPIISANYGAGFKERIQSVNRLGIRTAVLFGIVWSGVVMLFPKGFVRAFMTPTQSVLQIAPAIMRVYASAYLLVPLNIYATYYFQSVMKPVIALLISLLRGLVLCSLLVYILPAIFGAGVLWWVMPLTEFLTFLCVAAWSRLYKNCERI